MESLSKIRYRLWSPTGRPVAPSSTPVGRNPEQGPPAKSGAQVEGPSESAAPLFAEIIAIGSATGWAVDSVLVRIGLRKSNIFAAMLMSYAVSISCMWTYLIATTSLEFLKSPAMIYYVISGCMQPLFARALFYEGITRIGVARAGQIGRAHV